MGADQGREPECIRGDGRTTRGRRGRGSHVGERECGQPRGPLDADFARKVVQRMAADGVLQRKARWNSSGSANDQIAHPRHVGGTLGLDVLFPALVVQALDLGGTLSDGDPLEI